jgi:hypothetical protein
MRSREIHKDDVANKLDERIIKDFPDSYESSLILQRKSEIQKGEGK